MTIQELYATKTYQTPEEYTMRTGKPCPPYNPQKPQKFWEDPGGKLGRRIGQYVQYEYGLIREADGWTIGPFIMPLADAERVNIPPVGPTPPGADTSVVPVPLVRGLNPDERLVTGFGGIPAIVSANEPKGEMAEILELVRKIAKALGV
jgi:hypothetical protein